MAQAAIDRAGEGLSEAVRLRIAVMRAERRSLAERRAEQAAPARHLRPVDFPYQPEIERHLAALRAATARDMVGLVAMLAFLSAGALLCLALDLAAALPV